MGGRHSKRSMDVTTTPKKDGIPAEGDAPAVGDGKLERIEEADANTTKPTTNGVAPHTDTPEDKDNVNEKESATEKDKEKDDDENKAADESKPESPAAESPAETEQVTTPTEGTPASPKEVTSPDTKEAKKKDKTKKKWSFRSISFSKKDKSKPVREDTPKNGDVSKEEPLTEGGEEGENATEAVSPAEDKSASSPTDSLPESKDEEKVSPSAVTASPADENKEAPSSPAPTPVPEAKKEENEVPVEKVESIPEVEAPVENNVAEKTETVEEENKSPVPPVVSEPPASLGPAITEDVTSVTKAVEEIDINEKAVAAAVNENIEAVNKNEIIAEMNHQNNLNE
ncbi:A-kinase anchor protein 200-like isoform X2 [Microplitis mediator]|uniref:A-kinase anchor protein 200-like isoform X2 n=1 Tax=Microplitis mediator TaxID=375433 RepID=UPI002556A5B6|nr:A-kinase anchor protein 200-like isoform X2 [Microplitis mediator]